VFESGRAACEAAADLLGPGRCAGCGRIGSPLCRACRRALPPPTTTGTVAGADRVLAACAYRGAARSLVLALKLAAARPAASPLIDALARTVARAGVTADVVAWVPGRPADVRWRGFDHAEVLARGVAERLGLPASDLVYRVGSRPDQASLSAAERRRNLVGAFAGRPTEGCAALVDDVVTTGATASACCAALRAAGAKGVEVLAACRA
jgi:predicted amidophosphoribosyltransferase